MKKYLLLLGIVLITVFTFACEEDAPDELTEDEKNILDEAFDYQFSDKINFFFKTYYNFNLSDDYNDITIENFNPEQHLQIKNTTTLNYYGNNNNKTTSLSANITATFNNREIKEFPEKNANQQNGTKTGVQYLMTDSDVEDYIKTIDFNGKYNVYNDQEDYSLIFSKKFLKLDKKDLKNTYKNELIDASCDVDDNGLKRSEKIFNSFKITKEENVEGFNKIKLNFILNSKVANKYMLDIQLFAVDKTGYIYELIGVYNLSNNILLNYSNISRLTTIIDIEDIYIKAVFVDENENIHNLMYKEKYINL